MKQITETPPVAVVYNHNTKRGYCQSCDTKWHFQGFGLEFQKAHENAEKEYAARTQNPLASS
jgi:hypothetical protein